METIALSPAYTQIKNYKPDGISVILCCHNSASRIRTTLQSLAVQEVPRSLPIEVILIDNASSDDTAKLADEIWLNLGTEMSIRIVYEQEPGLIYARLLGIRVAKFEILIFCDDDNLLAPDYLMRAFAHFCQRPMLAAVGGFGIPVFEKPPPVWFTSFANSFAIGSQEVTSESGRSLNLYGAGLAVRKSALTHIYSQGYKPLMTGRKGTVLSGAEDTEMTYALVIAGYHLKYDDQMRFHHLLPVERLQFSYLERLFLASAIDGPIRNLYHAYATHKATHACMKYWLWHMAIAFARLVKYTLTPPKPGFRGLYFRWSLEYIRSLLICLPTYQTAKSNIKKIPPFVNLRIASLNANRDINKMPSLHK